MREFIDAIVSFPTVVYTSLLGVVVIYWGFVVIGALDVHFFDPGAKLDAAASGALEGASDGALEGAHDGAMDGAHDGAMDGAHDGAMDGAHDGAADGGHEGGADHAHEGQGDDHGPGGMAGLLALLGARGVPVTVVLSTLILWSWFLSGVGMQLVDPVAPSGLLRGLGGTAVGVAALVGGGLLTRLCVRPLRLAFPAPSVVRKRSVLGMPCRITTTKVTDRFGQAEVEDGGAGIIVQVRCKEANRLARGSHALIVHHDEDDDVFFVMPHEEKPL
jgi:hypothetical protein